ncbi:MAG: PAS domain S-box protein [Candidatus Delongbacteria bacterium]|nr:PAS domain S-box protein [Candidatus Delongbacteria bacterium]MCG2760171.1 ATP-binding protein [Candidatus Delongbacteria bacterium]
MGNEIKILVLEDDQGDIDLIEYKLKKINSAIHIFNARVKKEYIELLAGELPDIVLSDYSLSDMDGEEALSILRKRDKNIPFILISAVIGEEKAVQMMRKGANDYIMKDHLDKLIPTIEREIKEYEYRKQAEKEHNELIESQKELFESEHKYRTLADTGRALIRQDDIDGNTNYVNEVWLMFTGRKFEQEIGAGWIENVHPGDIEKYLEPCASAWEKRLPFTLEYRLKRYDGVYRWFLDEGTPRYNTDGEFLGYIGHCLDITERKEAEKRLELKQMELERSNNDLEQFAYTVSHDLQEPVRMVSGFTDMLKKKCSDNFDEETKTYINFAADGAKRMHDLIQGLLTYSRVSTKANPFELTDLRGPLDTALRNLSLVIKESSAEIIIGELPKVFADRSQISSVFLNLINNAIKFRKQDEKIKIEISANEIKDKNLIEIAVRDNGIGIDKKHFENIFLIFHRLHSQDKYSGTGIGLSVCKKIIERHGGDIRVESEINKGSTFYFRL